MTRLWETRFEDYSSIKTPLRCPQLHFGVKTVILDQTFPFRRLARSEMSVLKLRVRSMSRMSKNTEFHENHCFPGFAKMSKIELIWPKGKPVLTSFDTETRVYGAVSNTR